MSWLLVFVFGGLGALARHGISLWIPFGPGAFPVAIFLTNILGSLLIGSAYGFAQSRVIASEATLLAVTTGFLGGFTTFSTFSWQSLVLFQQGRWLMLSSYVVGTPVLGVLATALGFILARKI